jgi:hypothetical protein
MGIDSLIQQNMQDAGLAGTDQLARNAMFPQSQMDKTQYAVSSQLPTGAETLRADYDTPTDSYTGVTSPSFAKGGIAALRYDGEDGSQVQDPNPTEPTAPPTMAELADQLKLAYRTGTNYDDLWKQFASTKEQDPTQWYKHQLDFLGQQQGWQIGQNRSDRLSQLQPQIDNTIQQAKDAGVSEKEINSILGSSSNEGRNANVQRIANLAEIGGTGFNFQKDLQPGLVMLAAAAAAAASGGTAAPEIGELIGGSTFVPTAEGASFVLPEAGGITSLGADAGGATIGAEGGGATLDAGTQAAINNVAAGSMGAQTLPYGITSVAPELSSTLIPGAAALEAGAGGAAEASALTPAAARKALAAYTLAQSGLKSLSPQSSASMSSTGSSSGINTGTPPVFMGGATGYAGEGSAPDYRAIMALQPSLKNYAQGGMTSGITSLGSYSDGGQLLKGPGDGMSDHIPAKIGESQPARLADGEFVVPADVVSHLGNGSTDAGAKQLYAMMDRIRKARTGNKKQGKRINPSKFLP